MFAKTRNATIRYYNGNFGMRFRHKVIKNEEKKETKVAADLSNYLQNSPEYKEIIHVIPKSLLKKYKAPETMYLINKVTAKKITDTLIHNINKDAPIVEINPGFGFLTQELLTCQNNPVYLYEISNQFTRLLTEIKTKHPGRVNLKIGDFFGMWKLAFQDKMDGGSRLQELLGDLATDNNNRTLNILGAMPSLSFVKHLITTIVFHNETSQLGRPDLYITMQGHHFEFLTDSSIQMSKHKSMPALFQLLFDFEILDKVPRVHFLPWMWTQDTKKTSIIDEHCLYLVRITRKKTLPCAPGDLPLLWYFFKPQTFSKSTRIIPMLEQWIPGCGVWLITGQDPPDTNKAVAPGKDDASLPHMTIFTEFGDLNLQQKVTVFKRGECKHRETLLILDGSLLKFMVDPHHLSSKTDEAFVGQFIKNEIINKLLASDRFISWPEFEQCPFRVSMENNLPKFASHIDDEKTNIGAHIDEMESSDTEVEHDEG